MMNYARYIFRGGVRNGSPSGSLTLAAAAVFASAVILAAPAFAAASNPGVAPPDSRPHGASYGEWAAAWWQWAFSIKVHDSAGNIVHPLIANGVVDCGLGQTQNKVWFLAGTVGGAANRICTVPTGTALFFPMLNIAGDNVGTVPPLTLTQLIQGAADFVNNPVELHASISGGPFGQKGRAPGPLNNLAAYRAAFAPFAYTLPASDSLYLFFGIDAPGTAWPSTIVYPAVADGYWLMIEPLPPGTYVIKFGGTSTAGFAVDVTYTITVVPRGQV
jgi:hypothetical protein